MARAEASLAPRPSSRAAWDGIGRVLLYLLLTRLVLFIVAASAIRIVPAGVQPGTEQYLRSLSVGAWIRWDAWWYVSVAERGYWFDPDGKSSVAFFPLFPLLIRAVAAVSGNPVVAGLVLANLAAAGAVVALWWWVRQEAGPEAAERAALWLVVYPFSFFFHTVYAESLFFLLATLSLAAAGRRRWLLAGGIGALAAATRPMGVLLAPALGWGLLSEWRDGRRPAPAEAAGALLPVLGLLSYVGYLWAAFGDPLALWSAHATGWGVRFHWNLAGYWRETHWILTRLSRLRSYMQLLDVLRVVLPLVFVLLTVKAWRRLGPAAGVYAALSVAVGALLAPESVGRELLAAVPCFAALGVVGPTGLVAEGLRMLALGFLVVFLGAFVTGHFVG